MTTNATTNAGTTAARRLSTAELPLVLFAGLAHPDEPFRNDLLRRLDAAIDTMEPEYPRPVYSRVELRRLFYKLDRHHKGGIVLGSQMRELVLRLALLAFTKPTDRRQCRLLVGDDEAGQEKQGYVIDAALRVIDLRRSSQTRHRLNRQQAECRFVAGAFRRRLVEIQRGEQPVQAFCRVEDRLVLEFRGGIPWNLHQGRLTWSGNRRSPYPGWGVEASEHRLRLWPETPEDVLRLTAGMAAGKVLTIRDPQQTVSGAAILVKLRDFDGNEAQLPVKVTRSQAEPWLKCLPCPPLELTPEDRRAIACWAYPVSDWLTNDLVEQVL